MIAVPPADDAAHLDNVLMAEVADLNTQLGRYVLQFLDVDAGRAEPLSVADELALADRVNAMAEGLRARAVRRGEDGEPPRLLVRRELEPADG